MGVEEAAPAAAKGAEAAAPAAKGAEAGGAALGAGTDVLAPAGAAGADAGGAALGFGADATGGLSGGGLDAITGAAGEASGLSSGAGFSTLENVGGAFDSGMSVPGATAEGGIPVTIGDAGAGGLPSDLTGSGGFNSIDAAAGKPGINGVPDAGGGKGILDSLGLTKNPLGTAIAGGGLAYNVLKGQQAPKFSPEIQAQADRLDANGKLMMSYLQSGTLPPGLKTSLDAATASAKSKVISDYAARGLSTDPTKNSALAQQLMAIDQQATISIATMGQQLMNTGLAESGLSSQLYRTLAQIDQTQTTNIGKAIANFAGSFSGNRGNMALNNPGGNNNLNNIGSQ